MGPEIPARRRPDTPPGDREGLRPADAGGGPRVSRHRQGDPPAMGLSRFSWVLLAPVPLALMFVGGPGDAPRCLQHAWNLGHIGAFMLWAWLPARLSATWRQQPLSRQAAVIMGVTLVVGAAIEWLQAGLLGSRDWLDLARDGLGAALALGFLAPYRSRWPAPFGRRGRVVLAVLSLVALLPMTVALADDLLARHQMPLLAGFETPLEMVRWSGSAPQTRERRVHCRGRWGLRVNLGSERYSGVSLKHAPGDWQRYAALQLAVFIPDDDVLELTVRIHDRQHRDTSPQLYHDRFNRRFRLQPGWNRVVIPLAEVAAAPRGRSLDLAHIAGVGIFATSLPNPRTVYLDDVRLLAAAEVHGEDPLCGGDGEAAGP